jgi:hypothetical protein
MAKKAVKSVKKVAVKTVEFKRGDWLVRKWKNDCGGEVDVCMYLGKQKSDKSVFTNKYFFRFLNDTIVGDYSNEDGSVTPYNEVSCEYNWRKATQEELKKFAEIFIKRGLIFLT